MTMSLGQRTVRSVLEANMIAEVDSPLGATAHHALLHPASEYRRGIADMAVVVMDPPAWGVLARWARGRASRIHQGATKGERAEAKLFGRLAWRISTELERLAAHPAYHSLAVMGVEPTILPAYRVQTDDFVGPLAPTPDLAVKLADYAPGEVRIGELMPYALSLGGGRAQTVWMWHEVAAPTPPPQ